MYKEMAKPSTECQMSGSLSTGASARREEEPDPRLHAERAAQLGVLGVIASMASQVGQQAARSDMQYIYCQTLLGLMSTLICAFGLSPASLPTGDLSTVVQILASLFDGEHMRGSMSTDLQGVG